MHSVAPDGARCFNFMTDRGPRSPRWGSLAHVCYPPRLTALNIQFLRRTAIAETGVMAE